MGVLRLVTRLELILDVLQIVATKAARWVGNPAVLNLRGLRIKSDLKVILLCFVNENKHVITKVIDTIKMWQFS